MKKIKSKELGDYRSNKDGDRMFFLNEDNDRNSMSKVAPVLLDELDDLREAFLKYKEVLPEDNATTHQSVGMPSPFKGKKVAVPKKERQCSNCKETGHEKRTCPNPVLKYHHSDATKKKMRAAALRRVHSTDTIAKLSTAARNMPPETRLKVSMSHKKGNKKICRKCGLTGHNKLTCPIPK
jgi:hypothetical protein